MVIKNIKNGYCQVHHANTRTTAALLLKHHHKLHQMSKITYAALLESNEASIMHPDLMF